VERQKIGHGASPSGHRSAACFPGWAPAVGLINPVALARRRVRLSMPFRRRQHLQHRSVAAHSGNLLKIAADIATG
jgi:hypothetical protein